MKEEANQSSRPFIVGLGLGILLLGLALGLVAYVLGAVVLIAGLGGWLRDDFYGRFKVEEEAGGEQWPFEGVGRVKLGMWLFLASETILFGVILASYAMVRMKSQDWPAAGEILSISHGTINTFILLTSSFTLVLGLAAIRDGNQRGLKAGLLLTAALGALFLVNKATEWSELFSRGFTFQSGLPGSTYYLTTGLHGLHVFAGLLGLAYLSTKAFRGGFTAENHDTVENFALYWHFVDIAWVFIFPLFYLIA